MRQRHFRNCGAAGQAAFVTNTCLDFVPPFASERRKVMMAKSLTDDLLHYGSALHAFVGRSVNAGARQTRFTFYASALSGLRLPRRKSKIQSREAPTALTLV
ncbi:MAG: hypothetical protein KF812_05545 [Fimbriimonadaceae bacterium]|nr:hypothetical protein [Fimbriimonadaceae bacterium]